MDFSAFISACGFEPPQRIDPGKIVRFSTNGKRGDDAGWALLFDDGEGGIVGDWRSGEQQVWQAEKVASYTPEQKINWQRAIENARREADAARKLEHEEVARKAAEVWATSSLATVDHPYLLKKGVKPHGMREYRGDLVIGGMACNGALLVPARRAADGALRSLQFINAEGEKRYFPRGEISRNCAYLQHGTRAPEAVCVVEGYATGASVAEATGHVVAVAFDAGNLRPVCESIRAKYPGARIIVCADNDVGVKSGKVENPGVTRAKEAAEAVNGALVVPQMEDKKCDFNDLAVARGVDAVRAAVGTISVENDATFLRHMVEQEGRSLCSPSTYKAEVKERIGGKYRREGCTLPWKKTHEYVIFQPKQTSLWAGINGHGKSALLNEVAMNIMLQGQKVWIASLEMPVAATLERMVRQASGLKTPNEEFIDAFHQWAQDKLFLHDHIGRESSKKIVAMMRYVHEKTGCQHYVIDSMMRVVRSPDDYAGQKEFIELICAAAHDLGIHAHIVAHMRKGQSEFDHVDKFDIKGAGEIADLVDNVFIVWRNREKEMKLADAMLDTKERGRWSHEADVILTCAKQRHGDWEGQIRLWYEQRSKAYHESDDRNSWMITMKDMGIEESHVPF